MKKIGLFIVVFNFSLSFFAQQSSVEFLRGDNIVNPKGHTSEECFYINNEGDKYVWQTFKGNAEIGFNLVDKDFKIVETKIEHINMSPYGYVIDNLEFEGEIYTAFSEYDKVTMTEKLFVRKWNDTYDGFADEGKEIIAVNEKLTSGIGPTLASGFFKITGKFDFEYLDDGLVIIYQTVVNGKLEGKRFYELVYFDRNFNETNRRTIELPYGRREMSYKPSFYFIGNDIYTVCFERNNQDIHIFHIENDNVTKYTFEIKGEGAYRTYNFYNQEDFEFTLLHRDNKDVLLYQEMERVRFNVNKKEFEILSHYTFKESDYNVFQGNQLQTYLNIYERRGIKPGVYNPSLEKISRRDDGGMFIVMTQNFYKETKDGAIMYEINSIVISLDEKGEVTSVTHVPKILKLPRVSLSNPIFYDDEIRIIHYDHPLNRDKSGEYIPKEMYIGQFKKEVDLVVITVDKQGQMKKELITTFDSKVKFIPYTTYTFIEPGVMIGELWERKKIVYPEYKHSRLFMYKLH